MLEINFSELNWFDITVLSVIFASTLFAVIRGFIKGVFSLITWVGASSLAAVIYPHAYAFLTGKVQSDKIAIALASFGVFIIIFVLLVIFFSKLAHLLDGIRGGVVDRTIGLFFGLARGALIVCLVFFSIDITSKMLHFGDEKKPGPSWFADAQTYDILQQSTNKLLSALPEDVPNKLMSQIDKFKEISLTMIENETNDEGNGLPRTLNNEERKMMKKVIAALPKEDLDGLYKKYENGSSGLTEIERMAIFREILTMYSIAVKAEKITPENIVPASDLAILDAALNGIKENKPQVSGEDNTGYKDMNIKQIDRLVGNVEDEFKAEEKK